MLTAVTDSWIIHNRTPNKFVEPIVKSVYRVDGDKQLQKHTQF